MDPGTVLGDVLGSVRDAVGLKSGVVIAPCTHDTGSAVAAVPGQGDDWAFLSCGTWSVLGTLNPDVVTTPRAYAAGVFNELTIQSRILCRNIVGLWLLQQARAAWMRVGNSYSYEEIVKLAAQAPEGGPLINADAPRFHAPQDMLVAIQQYCAETGQAVPQHPGETARCILESLAFAYRRWLDEIAALSGRSFRVLHMVGGGSKNSLLCQLTANATGLPGYGRTFRGNRGGQCDGAGAGERVGPNDLRKCATLSAAPPSLWSINLRMWQVTSGVLTSICAWRRSFRNEEHV